MKEYRVRYGRVRNIILAAVLPSLGIWPFISVMRRFELHSDVLEYLIIFAFLGCLIGFTLWLVTSIYPPAILNVFEDKISITFTSNRLIKPSDFTLYTTDIVSVTRGKIWGDDYIRFETKNPARKFQLSASSYNIDELYSFKEAMNDIEEMIKGEGSAALPTRPPDEGN